MTRTKKNIKPSKNTSVNAQQGTGMRCPACGSTTRVKSTNAMPDKGITERYRKCDACGIHFYTEEVFKRVTTPRTK